MTDEKSEENQDTETERSELEAVTELTAEILEKLDDYDLLNALLEYKAILQKYVKCAYGPEAMQHIREDFLERSLWIVMHRNVQNVWSVTDHIVS